MFFICTVRLVIAKSIKPTKASRFEKIKGTYANKLTKASVVKTFYSS